MPSYTLQCIHVSTVNFVVDIGREQWENTSLSGVRNQFLLNERDQLESMVQNSGEKQGIFGAQLIRELSLNKRSGEVFIFLHFRIFSFTSNAQLNRQCWIDADSSCSGVYSAIPVATWFFLHYVRFGEWYVYSSP